MEGEGVKGAVAPHFLYYSSLIYFPIRMTPVIFRVLRGPRNMSFLFQDELMEGYKREGIDPSPYYWFSDQVRHLILFKES